MLLNTKFAIDRHLVSQVKINENLHASLFGRNYSDLNEFKAAFGKALWITYRRNFAPVLVEKNKVPKLTSDSGWGCVIRCT
jgi:hypothetical protein